MSDHLLGGRLGAPFIDIDEQRTLPEPHRYVHGGFQGSKTRFSIYLPPPNRFGGRFFQLLESGVGGHEDLAMRRTRIAGAGAGMEFAFDSGAYLVESNQGHAAGERFALSRGRATDPHLHAYGASAASARFARELAREHYGADARFGYLYGGSGGALRSLLCLEHVPDLWNGAVPFVVSNGVGRMAMVLNAVRLLGPDAARVIDAIEPGGSGDPFDGLDGEQREALAALYRFGFPRGGEFSFAPEHAVNNVTDGRMLMTLLADFDAEYFRDFWSLRGYAGADGLVDRHVVEEEVTVAEVVSLERLGEARALLDPEALAGVGAQAPIGLRVAGDADPAWLMATLTPTSGAARGRAVACAAVVGDLLLADPTSPELFAGAAPGDHVRVDNRDFLAYCHSSRHQVTPEFPSFAQFLVDGRPIHPQRPRTMRDITAGVRANGRFAGKVIVVNTMLDAAAMPAGALDIAAMVREHLADAYEDRFRLWFAENGVHRATGPIGRPPVRSTRLIDYGGHVEQALRDLVAWVEEGRDPPASSGFRYADGQVILAASARDRGGIQPLVACTVEGGARAEATVGEVVSFEVVATVPPGAGAIVEVEWDFDGHGRWPVRHPELDGRAAHVRLTASHAFERPGTYFPSVRVTAHRDGDRDAADCRVTNLARVRVVVGARQLATTREERT